MLMLIFSQHAVTWNWFHL